MNGYNFSERVRMALAYARDAAAELQHEYVGTEHILLGVLRTGEGVAITVLGNFNVDTDKLRADVIRTTKPGVLHRIGPNIPYTSRAKKVLELAMSEARDLNHTYVGSEHLLLGLLREAKGIGGESLARAGVALEAARIEVVRVLRAGHRLSPVTSTAAVVRGGRVGEPWESLHEPVRSIVASAYGWARVNGRPLPDAADLLSSVIESSEEIRRAFVAQSIDLTALFADIRQPNSTDPPANE